MDFNKLLLNITLPNFLFFLFFVTVFAVSPYSAISSIIIGFIAITVLVTWGNCLAIRNQKNKLMKNNLKIAKIIDKIFILNNHIIISDIISENFTNDLYERENKKYPVSFDIYLDSTTYVYIKNWIIINKINKLSEIHDNFHTAIKHSSKLQIIHVFSTIFGLIMLLTGAVLEIGASVNSNKCIVTDTFNENSITLNKIGSAIFTIRLALAGAPSFLFFKIINNHYITSKHVKNILQEKYHELKYTESNIKN